VTPVIVSASFDDMRSRHIRLLQEAAKLGQVHVHLWSDAAVEAATGQRPKFPQAEREYLVSAIRYVNRVTVTDDPPADAPALPTPVRDADLGGLPADAGFPADDREPPASTRKKAVVTGCYDWFHSGHVAFFEEVSGFADLIVVVGHDRTITLLKGPGHPMFPQEERLYMVQAVRHVYRAMISSGMGWLDAEPEILRFKPDIWVVNEDGDRPEKREFCAAHGMEYRVLKRLPKAGLPKRESTRLRGFQG
jgi:cytidyltransferase-like protein